MRKCIVACLATAAMLPAYGADAVDSELDNTVITAVDLLTADTVLSAYYDQNLEQSYPEECVNLKQLTATLPRAFAKRVPVRDAWGEAFVLCLVEGYPFLVSGGPNGVLEFKLPADDVSRDTVLTLTKDNCLDDIVLEDHEIKFGVPLTKRERLRRTMQSLRVIGTAVEEYSIDHNWYPRQEGPYGSLSGISSHLEPTYVRDLPETDGWGHEFLYWSDERNYLIVSPGADGQFDQSYGPGSADMDFRGKYTDASTDMVFLNGSFAQWPERRTP